MKCVSGLFFLVAIAVATSACQTVVLAPGAEQVKITSNPSDVAGCQAVGNVTAGPNQPDWGNELSNRTFGLGGNVLFLTNKFVGNEGVAYRCK